MENDIGGTDSSSKRWWRRFEIIVFTPRWRVELFYFCNYSNSLWLALSCVNLIKFHILYWMEISPWMRWRLLIFQRNCFCSTEVALLLKFNNFDMNTIFWFIHILPKYLVDMVINLHSILLIILSNFENFKAILQLKWVNFNFLLHGMQTICCHKICINWNLTIDEFHFISSRP